MENLDYLAIRFHFGGAFVNSNGKLEYVGGGTAMSFVDIDKVSFPELKGHLADHMPETNVVRLHWLMPGKDLSVGLMLLVDNASCSVMHKHITDGGLAEIYVENVDMDADQGFEVGKVDVFRTPPKRMREDRDYRSFMQFYRSPSKASQSECVEEHVAEQLKNSVDEVDIEQDDGSESSDADFMPPPDEDSSAYDEEAIELRKFAKEIKRNIKAKKVRIHGNQIGDNNVDDLVPEFDNLEDQGSPYYDSSDDYSYEENSEQELKLLVQAPKAAKLLVHALKGAQSQLGAIG